VDVINIAADRQKFMTLTGELWRSAVPGILIENRRFNLPRLYLAPPLEFPEIFGIRKPARLPFHAV